MTDAHNSTQIQKVPPNQNNGFFGGLTASTIIIIGSIVGTGYVANYRLGKIEQHFDEHQVGGHLPQAIELVKLQGSVESVKIDVERLRRRVRELEQDSPLNFKFKNGGE